MSFKNLLTHYRTIIDTQLQSSLPTYFQRYDHQTPRTSKTCEFVTQGGKRIRPVLAMMYAQELGMCISTLGNVFCSLEVFHDFILAHDDIVDQDDLRWGKSTIHAWLQNAYPNLMIHDKQHFWQALGMIGGDVLHAMAQSYIFDAKIDDTTKILLLRTMNEAMLDVARGRYKQFLSDSMAIAEIDLAYIEQYNLIDVTASYTFAFPLKFAYAVVNGTMELPMEVKELCNTIGIVFQTGDDIIWLFWDPASSGKSNFGDIIQGKKTIPVYFAYKNASASEQLELDALIGNKNLTPEQASRCKEIISVHGLAPAKEYMQQYADKAGKLIDQMEWSEEYSAWWKGFLEYLLLRDN
jgi:geranylgeranyl pyrophosphate synthase